MSKNIQMQEKTSSGYDILYPQTIAAQIEDVYSKDETITAATKALYGLGATATPNQVFSAISTALDGKARIQTGSYVGTGTYGASNPCSLTFDFEVKLFSLYGSIHGQYNIYQTVAIGYGTSGGISFFPPIEDSYEIQGRERSYLFLKNNTVSWYSNKMAEYQCNLENYRYFYFAIK